MPARRGGAGDGPGYKWGNDRHGIHVDYNTSSVYSAEVQGKRVQNFEISAGFDRPVIVR